MDKIDKFLREAINYMLAIAGYDINVDGLRREGDAHWFGRLTWTTSQKAIFTDWFIDNIPVASKAEAVRKLQLFDLQYGLRDVPNRKANRRLRVYIASPYTKGDNFVNTRAQIDVADAIMNMGHDVFWPLCFAFQHFVHPRSWQDWLDADLGWVEVCDVVLRLPGESSGADAEVDHARKHNIPVVHSIEALERCLRLLTTKTTP